MPHHRFAAAATSARSRELTIDGDLRGLAEDLLGDLVEIVDILTPLQHHRCRKLPAVPSDHFTLSASPQTVSDLPRPICERMSMQQRRASASAARRDLALIDQDQDAVSIQTAAAALLMTEQPSPCVLQPQNLLMSMSVKILPVTSITPCSSLLADRGHRTTFARCRRTQIPADKISVFAKERRAAQLRTHAHTKCSRLNH